MRTKAWARVAGAMSERPGHFPLPSSNRAGLPRSMSPHPLAGLGPDRLRCRPDPQPLAQALDPGRDQYSHKQAGLAAGVDRAGFQHLEPETGYRIAGLFSAASIMAWGPPLRASSSKDIGNAGTLERALRGWRRFGFITVTLRANTERYNWQKLASFWRAQANAARPARLDLLLKGEPP